MGLTNMQGNQFVFYLEMISSPTFLVNFMLRKYCKCNIRKSGLFKKNQARNSCKNQLLPPKITQLFLEHKHNSVLMMLSEILVLTLVCVYVLVVLQRGSMKRVLGILLLVSCILFQRRFIGLGRILGLNLITCSQWDQLMSYISYLYVLSKFCIVTGSLQLVLGPV